MAEQSLRSGEPSSQRKGPRPASSAWAVPTGGRSPRPRSEARGRQVAPCARAPVAARGSRGRDRAALAGVGRGRGPRRRLCDFGFDLPGDELIPPYNRPRGDRENGCGAICVAMGTIACARGRGASPEKHSLCRRRVSLTARDLGRRGSGLSYPRSGAPGKVCPLRRVGIPGCCQTPRKTCLPFTAAHPVRVTSTRYTAHATVAPTTPAHTTLSLWLSLAKLEGGPAHVQGAMCRHRDRPLPSCPSCSAPSTAGSQMHKHTTTLTQTRAHPKAHRVHTHRHA